MAAVKVAGAFIFIISSLNILFTASSSLPITSTSDGMQDGNKSRMLFGRKLTADLDVLVHNVKLSRSRGGRGGFGSGSSGSRGSGSGRRVYGGTGARASTGPQSHRSGGVHNHSHTSNLTILTAAIFLYLCFRV